MWNHCYWRSIKRRIFPILPPFGEAHPTTFGIARHPKYRESHSAAGLVSLHAIVYQASHFDVHHEVED
jgi:hypothetical protein